jgi:hypothetical protein
MGGGGAKDSDANRTKRELCERVKGKTLELAQREGSKPFFFLSEKEKRGGGLGRRGGDDKDRLEKEVIGEADAEGKRERLKEVVVVGRRLPKQRKRK